MPMQERLNTGLIRLTASRHARLHAHDVEEILDSADWEERRRHRYKISALVVRQVELDSHPAWFLGGIGASGIATGVGEAHSHWHFLPLHVRRMGQGPRVRCRCEHALKANSLGVHGSEPRLWGNTVEAVESVHHLPGAGANRRHD